MLEQLHLPPGHDGASWGPPRAGVRSRWRPKVHRHAELELNLVLRGRARYLVGDRRYELRPGCLVWLFPGQEHFVVDQAAGYHHWILVWRPEAVARWARGPLQVLARDDPGGEWCRRIAADDLRELEALYAALASATGAAELNAGLGYAFLRSWRAFHRARRDRRATLHPAVAAALRVLAHEPGADLARLATAAGCTGPHLSRLFARQVGATITAFRQQRMLDRFVARHDARGGRGLLADALDAGFGSYAQFHRVFHARFGCGPREWFRDQPGGDATEPASVQA